MKPTATEKATRVEAAKLMLLNGLSRAQIVQNLTKRYDVKDRAVDGYLAEARDILQQELEAIRPYALAEHIAHRRGLRAQLRHNKDYMGELKAAQDEAKLLGLYVEHHRIETWQDEVVLLIRKGEITPDEARATWPELTAEFFARAGINADRND